MADRWLWIGDGVKCRVYATGNLRYYVCGEYAGKEYRIPAGDDEDKARALAAKVRLDIEQARYLGVEWKPPVARKPRPKAEPKPVALEAPKGKTVSDFAADFRKNWFPGKAKATERFYGLSLRYVEAVMGKRQLRSITLADVQEFYAARCTATSIATANHDVQVLSVMFNRAVEWGAADANPVERLKRLRPPEGADRFLFKEEAEALEKACSPRIRALVLTALHTGLRRGNLLALTWDQVDLPGRRITVSGRSAKGRRVLKVRINDTLHKVLDALPRSRQTNHVFWVTVQRENRLQHQGMTDQILKDDFADALEAAGIKGFRFHDLRHTYASWAVMAGVPLAEVGAVLGHRDYRLTQRYAHFAPDFGKRAVDVLDSFVPPSREGQEQTAG